MIPILFGSDEENFTSNGLGRLAEAISCYVTEERNGIYELEMEYPVGGRHFGQLLISNIIYCRANQETKKQAFRIYEVTDAIDGITTVRAQHISYQLTAIPVEPFEAATPAEAVGYLKSKSVVANPFTFTTDIDDGAFTVSAPDSVRAVIGGIDGNLLETLGAEVKWDMYHVHILEERGENRGKVVRYGKNITDITQEQSIEDTITGIYPYYTDSDGNYVDLPEKVLLAPTASLYPYPRILPVDFSESFAGVPTVAELRTMAQDYMDRSSIGLPRVSIEVKYVEDSDIAIPLYLCDTVKVVFEPLAISALAKVTEVRWDVLLDRYESAVIGFQFEDIAGTVIAAEKSAVKQSTLQTQKAVKQATEQTQKEIEKITYDFVEPQQKSTGSIADGSSTIVMAFYFTLENSSKVRFGSTVNFTIAQTSSGVPATLTVLYAVDGNQQPALHQDYESGDHILTLDFLTSNLSAGPHVFGVAFGMVGGSLA